MDFSYSEEHEIFKKTVREFCEKKIASKAKEIDEKGEIPDNVIKELARMGLLGITYSTDYGGSGADFTTAAIVAEEIARADISMATAVFYLVEAGWSFLFDKYGNQKAKEEILPRVTCGDAFLGSENYYGEKRR